MRIDARHIPVTVTRRAVERPPDRFGSLQEVREAAEREYIQKKLEESNGNVTRAAEFELHREINKIGQPVDHGEWQISPPTVDAYYDPQMNDINFPAGVLQPPLYDAKMDDAPNYGDTGGTIAHELTHGFDDEGSQFDAKGNLKNWWTKEDRTRFEQRTACVRDQYAGYSTRWIYHYPSYARPTVLSRYGCC